jgi:hypothetical protein
MVSRQAVGAALLVLAGAFSTASYAADKIGLSCSAVSFSEEEGLRVPSGTQSIVIDLAHGLVTMELGTFAIIQVTDKDIIFEDRAWRGQIDRAAWSGFIAPRGHVPGNVKLELSCEQVKP